MDDQAKLFNILSGTQFSVNKRELIELLFDQPLLLQFVFYCINNLIHGFI